MTTGALKVPSAGAVTVGSVVEFPAHWPVSFEMDGNRFLRSGYLETDPDLWPKVFVKKGNDSPHSVSLIGVNPDTGTIIGVSDSMDVVYRSVDGGISWTQGAQLENFGVHPGSLRYGNGVWMFNTLGGYAGASYYRSVDDGITWEKKGATVLTAAIEWISGDIWISGNGNTSSLLSYAQRSTNGGATFQAVNLPVSGYKWGLDIKAKPTNRNIVVMVGQDYTVRSSDGGVSWAAVHNVGGSCLATDGAGTWVKFADSQIWRSTDDGVTWVMVRSGTTSANKELVYIAELNMFRSATYNSVDGGLTWLTNNADMVQGAVGLGIFAHPFTGYAGSSSTGGTIMQLIAAAGTMKEVRRDSLVAYICISKV